MNSGRHPKLPEWTNGLLLALVVILAIEFWLGTRRDASAESHPQNQNIIANSVRTRSLFVVNPTGKQGVSIEAGDDGMVALAMTGVNGNLTIGLLSTPSGKPSICVAYAGKCRVVIGDVGQGKGEQASIQLLNDAGKPIWMPSRPNPVQVESGKHDTGAAVGPGKPK